MPSAPVATSPSSRSYFETLNTLQYAARAKLIVTNPKANMEGGPDAEQLRQAAIHAQKRQGGFDYLPRYVRLHHDEPPAATGRDMSGSHLNVGGTQSSRPDLGGSRKIRDAKIGPAAVAPKNVAKSPPPSQRVASSARPSGKYAIRDARV